MRPSQLSSSPVGVFRVLSSGTFKNHKTRDGLGHQALLVGPDLVESPIRDHGPDGIDEPVYREKVHETPRHVDAGVDTGHHARGAEGHEGELNDGGTEVDSSLAKKRELISRWTRGCR